ncbi:MAG: cytochrome c biogenesis protein CcsA [Humidesulfovibrio sp.]|uniref:cytochrome c biogenesis protein CcsA n=1 Tax=Humidesulfovibrio sp. TaxID=2910988 RepID=UPI0027E5F7E6|nr:cytochrome c biogenesis protein CcsA [Humidesulfovibrio sp.]MDQ7834688.1 cytochrome c biogenesis protein CcsA [Humidesulfovibrio sp.]
MPSIRILAALSVVALAVGQWFIWAYAPVEETMGLVQKIFYIHMPLAWWALVSFFVVFCASIRHLMTRSAASDILAGSAAELGVLFSGLALISGSIWGRAAWNVWWTWDPRLTTTLIMWFVYAGYLVLRGANMGGERRAMVCAVLGVVAFLDVPLVFYSARIWRSVHPAVLASQGGGMEPEMWHAVLANLLAFGLLWLTMLVLRFGVGRAEERAQALLQGREV